MIRCQHLWSDVDLIRAELRRADLIFLALDYDGTRSPIAARHEDARMAPETASVLRDLTASDRVSIAIISGRSVSDLKRKSQVGLMLGASLPGQKKYAEAVPLLLEGYQGMESRKDKITVAGRYHLDRAREWIAKLYQASGKPEKVAEWKSQSNAGPQ